MFKLPRTLSLRTKLILLSLIVEVVMLTLLVFNSVRLNQDSLIVQAQLRYTELNTLFMRPSPHRWRNETMPRCTRF